MILKTKILISKNEMKIYMTVIRLNLIYAAESNNKNAEIRIYEKKILRNMLEFVKLAEEVYRLYKYENTNTILIRKTH